MRTVKDTLAGRASYVTLWPLARREQLGLGMAGCWSDLIEAPAADWASFLEAQTAPAADWRARAHQSTYRPPALENHTPEQQADWLQGYLDAYIGRDVPDLSQISRPLDLLRLMRVAAAQASSVTRGIGRSLVTIVSVLLAPETRGTDIHQG